MSFTPGPWTARYTRNWIKIDAPKWTELARVAFLENLYTAVDYLEAKANANLIAAAPDMYAALEVVAHDRPSAHSDEVWAKVTAALAKARGES